MLDKLLGSTEKALNFMAAVGVLVLTALVTTQIVARYVFSQALPGVFESAELLMVAIVFLGLAYIQSVNGHVRMELLVNRMSRVRRRTMEGFTLLLSLVLFVIITYKSGQNAHQAWRIGDVTMGLINFPTWPAKMLVPIGAGLLCLRLVAQLWRVFVPGPLTVDSHK